MESDKLNNLLRIISSIIRWIQLRILEAINMMQTSLYYEWNFLKMLNKYPNSILIYRAQNLFKNPRDININKTIYYKMTRVVNNISYMKTRNYLSRYLNLFMGPERYLLNKLIYIYINCFI